LCSPSRFAVALPCFISFGHSFAMIMKKFFNRLRFLSRQM
jgi:hypothetical protein